MWRESLLVGMGGPIEEGRESEWGSSWRELELRKICAGAGGLAPGSPGGLERLPRFLNANTSFTF